MAGYEGNPAYAFMTMLDPANRLAPGDPVWLSAKATELEVYPG